MYGYQSKYYTQHIRQIFNNWQNHSISWLSYQEMQVESNTISPHYYSIIYLAATGETHLNVYNLDFYHLIHMF